MNPEQREWIDAQYRMEWVARFIDPIGLREYMGNKSTRIMRNELNGLDANQTAEGEDNGTNR